MSVPREVSWTFVEEELAAVELATEAFGWSIELQPDELRFTLLMTSKVDGERYLFEFTCDDYKLIPPFIEMIHPDTGARAVPEAYPKNGRSFFHTTPAICAPFSRKAYVGHAGIHNEWELEKWMELREGISTLGDILVLLQNLLNNPDVYHGRMG